MIKKLLVITVSLLFVLSFGVSAFADNGDGKTIHLISHYKPGGSHGRALIEFKKYLDGQGYDTTIEHIPSCSKTLDKIKNEDGSNVLITISTEYKPGDPDAWCQYTADGDGFEIVHGLWQGPIYLCNVNNNKFTINDLFTKDIKIGTAVDSIPVLNSFLDNLPNGDKLTAKVIPYRGGGALRRAVASHDVDMSFMSFQPGNNSTTCIGASDVPNPINVDFYGKYTADPKNFKYNYQVIHYFLGKAGVVYPYVKEAIDKMLKSDMIAKWMKKNNYSFIDDTIPLKPILKKYHKISQEFSK